MSKSVAVTLSEAVVLESCGYRVTKHVQMYLHNIGERMHDGEPFVTSPDLVQHHVFGLPSKKTARRSAAKGRATDASRRRSNP